MTAVTASQLRYYLIFGFLVVFRYSLAHELVHGRHDLGQLPPADAAIAVEVVQLERPL